MFVLLTSGGSGYVQLIVVLLIFVCVLGLTAWVTKWIANYQKGTGSNRNIEVIESAGISPNKFVQIIRVGDTYKVICNCKDTVTYLGDLDKEQLELVAQVNSSGGSSFKEILERLKNKDSNNRE